MSHARLSTRVEVKTDRPVNSPTIYNPARQSIQIQRSSKLLSRIWATIPLISPNAHHDFSCKQAVGVAHLPGGRRIITCSGDGSLRLWDLESGAQIGDEWRDEGDSAPVLTMALSPNGGTVASGSQDGTVRLWDVETGKVVVKWKGHTNTTMIATCGFKGRIKIWDAKTGKLLSTIKHRLPAWSLAWTSDEKKLIAGLKNGSIGIFDTATWQQITVLEGHTQSVYSITLFPNDRLLASTSWDNTARLWSLDTNLQVGSPLQHEDHVECAAFSADGKLLSTACDDNNVYVRDIQAILKTVGLEDLLSIPDAQKSELKKKSL